jgi:ribonuclease PH
VDRKAMGEMSITLDCDVLTADGGTRCAAITGAWVALHQAFAYCMARNVLARNPLTGQVAAVSCGLWQGEPVLDLDYAEDSAAQADANFVLTDSGGLVEVQAAAEGAPFSEGQLLGLMALAKQGTALLFTAQRKAIAA